MAENANAAAASATPEPPSNVGGGAGAGGGGAGAASGPAIFQEDIPLCASIDEAAGGGTIRMLTGTPFATLRDSLDGVFSFVYYYKKPVPIAEEDDLLLGFYERKPNTSDISDFIDSRWYKGLHAYLDFIHRPMEIRERGEQERTAAVADFSQHPLRPSYEDSFKQEDIDEAMKAMRETPPMNEADCERFNKWGAVIYTNQETQEILRAVFPFSEYPRLMIAVVYWPKYSLETGMCEPTIMRCLRYQAIEAFPAQTILVRDADSIFVRGLYSQPGGENLSRYKMMWWESEFLNQWPAGYTQADEDIEYRSRPVLGRPSGVTSRYAKYVKLKGNIIIGTMSNYQSSWHSNIPVKFAPSKQATQFHALQRVKYESYAKEGRYESPRGVFAGFVNLPRKKAGLEELWPRCLRYLFDRYFIGVDGDKRVISDHYCEDYSGYPIGKDEKLLLFVFPSVARFEYPVYIRIQYYYIEYSGVGGSRVHPSIANSPSWVVGYYQNKISDTITHFYPLMDHLLTPQYNQGVMKTLVKPLVDDLTEEQEKFYEQYKEFIRTSGYEEKIGRVQQKIRECNLHLRDEQLFLQEAGIQPLAEMVAAPLPAEKTRENYMRKQEEKKAAERARRAPAAPAAAEEEPPAAGGGGGGVASAPRGGTRRAHRRRKNISTFRNGKHTLQLMNTRTANDVKKFIRKSLKQ
jgi:hypothetical protein